MKLCIICIVLLLAASTVNSQPTTTTTPTPTKQDYLKRSKNQKVAAWLFLAGGGTCIALGAKDRDDKQLGNSEGTRSNAAVIAGVGAVGISTVLFIASARNKKKGEAMAFDFKMEKAPTINGGSLVYSSYPALSLRIKL